MSRRLGRLAPMDLRRADWESRAPSADAGDRQGRHDRYRAPLPASAETAGDPGRLLARASDAILRYDIYPPGRMRSLVCSPDARVRPNAIIIQRIFFGLAATEAAVRVVDVFGARAPNIVQGFSYVTLEGHAEKGVATFTLTRDPAGALTFNIESWSRPGGGAASLMAPLSRLLQRRFSIEALAHFVATAQGTS